MGHQGAILCSGYRFWAYRSILGIWETIFGYLGVDLGYIRVNFGHMEMVFWAVNGEFRFFFNSRPLILDVYESSLGLWELLFGFGESILGL